MEPFNPDSVAAHAAEQAVLGAVARGEWASFPAELPRPTLRAAFLRHLLLGLPVGAPVGAEERCWSLPATGLRIRHARVEGRLDLMDAGGPDGTPLPPLALEDCELPDPIDLTAARLARLSIRGSRFSELTARFARLAGPLEFSGAKPLAETAWIDGHGLAVEGDVLGQGAQLAGVDSGDARDGALLLSNAVVTGDVDLSGSTMTGLMSLDGARVTGKLTCAGTRLRNRTEGGAGDALVAEGAEIGGAVLLRNGFDAEGRVSLLGARIGGNLECDGAKLRNRTKDGTGIALLAQSAEIGGALLLDDNFDAEGCVSLLGARIAGSLQCNGARLRNRTEDGTGTALLAEGAKIGVAVLLRNGFDAEGRVSLLGAKIAGNLNCGGAKLRNRTKNGKGIALDAENAEIGGAVLLRGGFIAEGHVSLHSARIATGLSIRGATFLNPAGAALAAVSLEVGDSLILRDVVVMGHISLSRARVGAALEWTDLRFPRDAKSGEATIAYAGEPDILFDLSHATIATALQPRSLTAEVPGHIDLQGLRAGSLDDDQGFPAGWGIGERHSIRKNALGRMLRILRAIWYTRLIWKLRKTIGKNWTTKLDGMTYDRLNLAGAADGTGLVTQRLAWLRNQDNFRPQPYRQLAKVLRLQGHADEARAIAIAEQDATPIATWFVRVLWHYFWGFGFGYGLAPMRAVCTLLAGIALGTAGTWWANEQAKVMVLSTSNVTTAAVLGRDGAQAVFPAPASGFGAVELPCDGQIISLFYAIDVMLPVIPLHQQSKCEISTEPMLHADKGLWLGVTFWRWAAALYSILGKIVTALALITFSGIVRRREEE